MDHSRPQPSVRYFHRVGPMRFTSVLAIVALLAGNTPVWNWYDPNGYVGCHSHLPPVSWGLLKATSRVLLDQQQNRYPAGVKRAY